MAMLPMGGIVGKGRGERQPVFVAPDAMELTSIRRTAKVVAALVRGEGLTVRQVQDMTGLTRQGAEYLLAAVSNVIEIYHDPLTGIWQLCVFRELD